MAKRSSGGQKKHDQQVKQIANGLKRKGWRVKADIPGYDQPDAIGKKKHIPDIQATKAGATRLVEVETEDTMQTDKEQHETFRRSAAQRNRTSFQLEEA